jgi:hypothetical protein
MPASPAISATGASGASVLFIYYRVAVADLAAAVVAARVAQQALCDAHPGLQASLMQRPSSATEPPQVTLLETYRTGSAALALPVELIEQRMTAALAPWLRGPRRIEVFEPCA